MSREKELQEVMDWVTSRLRYNDVPRVSDVVTYAKEKMLFKNLTKNDIAAALRLHPAYVFNSSQQRERFRARKYRPVVSSTLGNLHADLGFFAVTRNYETPKMYRSGFLVAKDVLSRFTYVVILRGSKDADSLVRAFADLLRQYGEHTGGDKVQSISFDKETSVMGKTVQKFFRDNNVAFHPFSMTASKSKFAESAIRLIRTELKRLEKMDQTGKFRWWNNLQTAVDSLNAKPVVVDGKRLPFAPRDINSGNLPEFLRALHKAVPAYFWNQYALAPQLVKFKFEVGTFVRPKLIVTSSAVVGNKRSEINLESDIFIVTSQCPYVNRRRGIGRAYRCTNLRDHTVEVFEEDDLAETPKP